MPFVTRIVAALLLVASVGSARAENPRDELLRLAPGDAGFGILIQNLREHADRLIRSPFADRLAASPIGRAFRDAPESKQLAAFDLQLRQHLNLSWAQLRDDVLGDAIVLCFTPGPPGQPDGDQGLALAFARRPEQLSALIDRLNGFQKQSGEIDGLEDREFEGQRYVCRRKPGGAEYYFQHGPIFALSNSESCLRQVIERDRRRSGAERGSPSQRLNELGVASDLAVLWINPRAFDAAIEQQARSAAGEDAEPIRTFAACWSAIDGVALSLRLTDDAAVSAAVRLRPDAMPPTVRRVLEDLRRPSAVWSAFPADALLAVAGRTPWERPAPTAESNLPSPSRRTFQDALDRGVAAVLTEDVLPELLRRVGPDWGFCVAPPDRDEQWWPNITAAVQLQFVSETVKRRVLGGLDAVARLGVLTLNNQRGTRWKVRVAQQGDVDVRYLDGGASWPAGLQPAFAWKGGYLVLASSPAVINRFAPPADRDSPAVNGEVPIARLAVAGWVNYLRKYRPELVNAIAAGHKLPAPDVDDRLGRLIQTLELFDGVALTRQADSGRATLTLRLRPAASLNP